MTNGERRRATDRFTFQAGLSMFLGALIIGAAVALKFLANASDTLVIVLAVIGGVLIPGNHIASAIKAWKKP